MTDLCMSTWIEFQNIILNDNLKLPNYGNSKYNIKIYICIIMNNNNVHEVGYKYVYIKYKNFCKTIY